MPSERTISKGGRNLITSNALRLMSGEPIGNLTPIPGTSYAKDAAGRIYQLTDIDRLEAIRPALICSEGQADVFVHTHAAYPRNYRGVIEQVLRISSDDTAVYRV